MEITRRGFFGASAGALAGCAPVQAPEPESRPPNIVFVMLDDLGYADFGCYGGEMIETPNVDRFCAESVKFTDCYAGATVCAPSRSVLMTGMHTGHSSIRANAGTAPILPSDYTVGEMLREAGYVTGVFGKWGLGDAHTTGAPEAQGFDESFGYLHQIHAHTYYPEFLWKNGGKYPLPGNAGGKQEQWTGDIIFEESLEFVKKNRDRPFFLYGAYTLPHGRFEIPSDAPYAGKDWPQVEKNYAAMVTRADEHIGRLWRTLQELGLEEDTVFFVTSDNGGTPERAKFFDSNKPLRGGKGNLYEGGIRVPMMVRWAGKTDAGRVCDVPWAFWDFMPTAAELAGTHAPERVDGVSVLPMLIGSSRPVHEHLYWEHNVFDRETGALRPDALQQAVRMGDWKAVIPKAGRPLELYNLADDVGERSDVAASNQNVVPEITEYLADARTGPRPQVGGVFTPATE